MFPLMSNLLALVKIAGWVTVAHIAALCWYGDLLPLMQVQTVRFNLITVFKLVSKDCANKANTAGDLLMSSWHVEAVDVDTVLSHYFIGHVF